MSTFTEFSALQPTIIEGLVIARGKQWGPLAKILPEELHTEGLAWNYQTYDDAVALPAKEASPGTEASISEGDYNRITITAKPFRAKSLIDKWLRKWSVIDAVKQKTDSLTDKIQRAQEYRITRHLTNFGQAAAGATLAYYGAGTYPYMASKDKTGSGWDDATDGAKFAIADILEAKKWIRKNALMGPADTLIVNPDIEEALLKQATIRETMYWGGQGPPVIVEGKLAKFMGLDIIVVDGTYQDEQGTEAALLDDRAIILHRGVDGSDLGVLHVAEPLYSSIYADEKVQGDWIEVGKTLEPHIWRQKCCVNVIDCIAPS
jgi:hypothetical protein